MAVIILAIDLWQSPSCKRIYLVSDSFFQFFFI